MWRFTIPQWCFLFQKVFEVEILCLGAVSKQEKQEDCAMVPVSWESKPFVTSEGGFNSALEETKHSTISAKAESRPLAPTASGSLRCSCGYSRRKGPPGALAWNVLLWQGSGFLDRLQQLLYRRTSDCYHRVRALNPASHRD